MSSIQQFHPRAAAAVAAANADELVPRLRLAMQELVPEASDDLDAAGLARLAERLDEEAFDLSDAVDRNEASADAYFRAFRRARAAASLSDLAEGDLEAASYEALHAVGADDEAFIRIIG